MLTAQFLPEVFGGAEQQCLRLSKALVAGGHRPTILTSCSDPTTPTRTFDEGVEIYRIRTPDPPQQGGRRLRSTFSWMAQVSRWFQANRAEIDLVHCHQAKLNAWVGVRMARRFALPCLVKPGSAGPNFDLTRLERKRYLYGRLAAREIAQDADRFIAISAQMTEDLQAYGVARSRIVQIPNGIALHTDTDARLSAGGFAADAGKRIVFCGRIERQKNIDTLLRSLAALPRRDWTCVFLGDGTGRADAEALAETLDIGPHCRFVGRVDNPRAWMQAADLFVLPALAEGMSNALLEAMSVGCVPVASAVSGNTDLITPGANGFLYGPPRDVAALTAALTRALALAPGDQAVVGARAAEKIAQDHSLPDIAKRYTALYRTMLNARGPV